MAEMLEESNVSPWDALLHEVRRSAGRVGWIDQQSEKAAEKFRQIEHEASPEDGVFKAHHAHMRSWMMESRRERAHMAKVAKAAIDAGIASVLVRQAELDGQKIAMVLGRALDALDLDEGQRTIAARALRLALEEVSKMEHSPDRMNQTLQGELVEAVDEDPPPGPEAATEGDETSQPDEPAGPEDDGPEEPPEPPQFRNPGDFI